MPNDQFSADIEGLKKGGVDVMALGKRATDASDQLKDAHAAHGRAAFGNNQDSVSKQLHTVVDPIFQFGTEVLDGLGAVLTGHGTDVTNAGKVIGRADTDATDTVGRRSGG